MKGFDNFTDNSIVKRVAVALAAAIIIVWFYPHQRNNKYFYEEGRPWNYAQLIAPFDIPIHPDSLTVDRLRDTLDAHFVPIYTIENSVIDSIEAALPRSPYRATLLRLIGRLYEDGVVETETMNDIRSGKLKRLRVLDENILSERSTEGLLSPRDLYMTLDSLITDPGMRQYFIGANLHNMLKANLTFCEEENKRHYDNEYLTLTADRGVILQGQAIINKGDIISAQDFTNLRTYEQLLDARLASDTHSWLLAILGQTLYVVALLAMLMLYLALLAPPVYANLKAIVFIYGMVTVFFLFSAGLSAFIPGGVYVVPLSIVAILTLVFFDSRTALFVSMTTIMIIAPITSFALEFIFIELSAAAAAVYSLRELQRRSQLLATAGAVALAYLVGYLSLELLMNGSFEGFSWRMPVFLIVNAVLTSTAYILMSAVERMFGFVSTVTLTELADTNQPLLRKLSDVCPGTFQHSMTVSNLATDAARAMGANEQLVRAGALYHDIGKMSNPAFFTENQHGVNPHDALSPQQSAGIVIGHVTDGLKMAEKAGIPAVIRNFISEHHGAGKAKYFYYTYCQAHPDEAEHDPAPFTYPGPNPRSRETSLLMMADAVEAASRSLGDYSRQSITDLVNKIIDTQIAEGLHNDSTLEFRDVPVIKEAFVKRLMTVYHTRIAYPTSAGKQQAAADDNK